MAWSCPRAGDHMGSPLRTLIGDLARRGTMHTGPLAFLNDDLRALKEAGIYRTQRVLETEQAARVVMDDKPLVTLSTNNYLGLTTHPRLKAAAIAAIEEYGVGAGSVRTI